LKNFRVWTIRSVLLLMLLGALSWPFIYNHGPFFFSDSIAYATPFDHWINKYTGIVSPWTKTVDPVGAKDQASSTHQEKQSSSWTPPLSKDQIIMYPRSLFYGFLLYVGGLLGGGTVWVTVMFHAVTVVLSIAFMLRLLEAPIWPNLLYIGFALCIVTDAPFFITFLMPDIYAGIVILLLGSVFILNRKLTRKETLLFCTLTMLSLLFHHSVLLVALLLLAIFLAGTLLRFFKSPLSNCVVIMAVLLLGFLVQFASDFGYKQLVRHVTGYDPSQVPFLTARLIADGPGTQYLRETCPQSGFTVCSFLNRFPEDEGTFLWDPGKEGGIFFASPQEIPPTIIRKICAENFDFAEHVFLRHPTAVLGDMAQNSAHLFSHLSLDEFNYAPKYRIFFDEKLSTNMAQYVDNSMAYKEKIPVKALSALYNVFVIAAVVYFVFRRVAYKSCGSGKSKIAALFFWVLTGILLNAVVCGSIAGVYSRYETRVTWLLPLLAIVACGLDGGRLFRGNRKTRLLVVQNARS